MEVLCFSLFCVLSSFAIILKRKIDMVDLLLYYGCLVTVKVLWLFLMVPSVGLQCVFVVFPDHTHLLFKVFLDKILIFILMKEMSLITGNFILEPIYSSEILKYIWPGCNIYHLSLSLFAYFQVGRQNHTESYIVVDSLFNVPRNICGSSVLVFVLLCISLCSFYFC